MLTFNTQFPIEQKNTIENVFEVIRTWLLKSPHSELQKEQLAALTKGEDCYIKSKNESLQLIYLSREQHELIGAKHTTTSDSIRWTTEISGSKKEYSFWISIQVSCDNSVPTHKIPNTKKPHIIKLLLEKLKGGKDGELDVTTIPIELNSKEISLAANIINGTSSNLMPAVYVSANKEDKQSINISNLSYQLSGMAHIIVEPNRDFSFELRRETKNKNAYGGAVAVYWPEGLGRYLFLPWGKYENPETVEIEIKKIIKSALLSMRPLKDCNYQYISEQKARVAIEALISSGSTQIDEYISHFDTEIMSLREEILKLERENTRLKSQAFSREHDEPTAVSIPTNETELYEGELQDTVIDAFELLRSQTPEKHKRRLDLINSALLENPKIGRKTELIKTIKDALTNYQRMDDRTKKTLERIGFEIISEGNHYKLTFNGDNRYIITLAKTPSDFRNGKNTASDLCGVLFGGH
ncbi:hypothetical protein PSGK_14480 [Pseudomonas solani]|uniref:hypothetical protein n=1 Tax=Pseudomonas solani TaxID=2731552 RepID=UPI0035BE845C